MVGFGGVELKRSDALPIALGVGATLAIGAGVLLGRGGSHQTVARLLKVGGAAALGGMVLASCGSPGRDLDGPTPTTPLPPPTGKHLVVSQLNAKNLFDTEDGYGSDTVLTKEQYDAKLGKLGLAIRDAMHGPDIIAMQEVENQQVLDDLVKRPEIRDLGYETVFAEGTDPRGIDVAYLYRPERVELVGWEQMNKTNESETGREVKLFTRPPLVATFRPAEKGWSGSDDARMAATFTMVNNHFTSKLQGDEGEDKRLEQAAFVTSIANGSAGAANLDPERVIVLGDFNEGLGEPAYRDLVNGRHPRGDELYNVADHLEKDDRYSFRDGSTRQLLDHMLVTPGLNEQVRSVRIPHINSDPSEKQYDVPDTFERSSDHDPVIVEFATK